MNALTVNGKQLTVDGVEILGYGVPAPVLEEVTIGKQTWLAKNLAIDDGGDGIYTRVLNYGQSDVTEYYYNWDAAMRIAESLEGWHVPTLIELQTLLYVCGDRVAGLHTKSTYGWYDNGNGDDRYGLSIFPAGYWYNDAFYDEFNRSIFWTSTKQTETRPYAFNVAYNTNIMSYDSSTNLTQCLTVRLIKD